MTAKEIVDGNKAAEDALNERWDNLVRSFARAMHENVVRIAASEGISREEIERNIADACSRIHIYGGEE